MGLRYSKFKIFHFKNKINSLPLEKSEILSPIHIRIKPTNVCGHRCWYCAYRADNLQLGRDMITKDYIPREKMFEIIEDLEEIGVGAITFSGGGDPFYYPYLLETVKRLSKTNIKFASLTNGSKLEGEIANIFAHYATWLRISIDGWDDESYAWYRGVKIGDFARIMNNIENFIKLGGKCYLGVSLIVDKKNATHVYEFVGRLKDTGINSVKISPCVISDSGVESNAYHHPIFNIVKEQIQKAIVDFSDSNFEIFDSYHTLENKFKKDYEWCPYLQILPIIGADLNIYPCQDKAYNLNDGLLGSIKDKRFKEFWFSDKKKFFKINPSKVCNHHCVANEKNKIIFEYLNSDSEHLVFV